MRSRILIQHSINMLPGSPPYTSDGFCSALDQGLSDGRSGRLANSAFGKSCGRRLLTHTEVGFRTSQVAPSHRRHFNTEVPRIGCNLLWITMPLLVFQCVILWDLRAGVGEY